MEARIIKFRAWDAFNGIMVEPYRFVHSTPADKIEGDERFNAPFIYYESWQDEDDGISRPCYIMQHVGFLDKNRTWIYEGDIVVCHDHPTGADDITGTVYFKDGKFMVEGSNVPLGDYGTAWIEVIGNIYQNSELLKK